jgi:hypothetical protein
MCHHLCDNFVAGIGERNHHLIRGGDFFYTWEIGTMLSCFISKLLFEQSLSMGRNLNGQDLSCHTCNWMVQEDF